MKKRIKYKTYTISTIPKDIYKQCYSLNFRKGGSMQETVAAARNGLYDANICVCLEGKTVVSWCMRVFNYYPRNTDVFMTYTRRTHRRRGIGGRLYRRLDKKTPGRKSRVITNDKRARTFYESVLNRRRTKILFERAR